MHSVLHFCISLPPSYIHAHTHTHTHTHKLCGLVAECVLMRVLLERYLRLFGQAAEQYLEIPLSFTQKCGWLLADIVQHLSHCAIDGLPLTRPETLNAEQQRAMLAKMLTFLQSRGALLHSVSLTSLLQTKPQDKHVKAWVAVLAQVVRVLVLGQLPPLPGSRTAPGPETSRKGEEQHEGTGNDGHGGDGDDDESGGSSAGCAALSCYGDPARQLEALVAWVNHCVDARGDAALSMGMSDFTDDLRDSLVLADLIVHHVPELDELDEELYRKADTPAKLRHNAICIVQALQRLRISLSINSDDLWEPSEAFMILVLCRLAVTLPKFSAPPTRLETKVTVGAQASLELRVPNAYADQAMLFHTLSFGSSRISIPNTIKRESCPLTHRERSRERGRERETERQRDRERVCVCVTERGMHTHTHTYSHAHILTINFFFPFLLFSFTCVLFS